MAQRLVAVDMDGTFLDGQGNIPAAFWDLYPRLREAEIIFVPASGRQLATLRDLFQPLSPHLHFIAENGTVVAQGEQVLSTTPMSADSVHSIIDAVKTSPSPMDLVICKPQVGYVDHPDAAAEVGKYYHSVKTAEDLHSVVDDSVIKVAIYSERDAESYGAPRIREAAPQEHTVISGAHWIDVMSPQANKGRALAQLCETLGISPQNSLAFGDYLNDLELLQQAGTSYAMSNAHPLLKEQADHIAPPNTEAGVITVLESLLA
ncbi:Cof-type HAD-IIB family hydrolase [Corynebacterium lowii]|uniref:Flavin mononucleotide phosphatase YbjI n=1 Tax=Corynebacterium lowii TaxID=1544413 RepID=A0A0N8W083_9CORY|nr:Cof-type HAD-IIB family hydrolase [Corynebacterium lowii]KQB85978.1 Flavin mononucleotide phosphatase YbjI [Corynebacterium lowii]MDP9850592.1 Cof subfamily protein (haloacid dehalogenase superfamily) [Corynebacterium lowii]